MRPIRESQSSGRKSLISMAGGAIIATFVLLAVLDHQPAAAAKSTIRRATNSEPLVYNRLRFDEYFLQVYRRYQKYLAIDEKRLQLKVNETLACPGDRGRSGGKNNVEEVTYDYYENDQVDATSFTYDDMVFEAIDRVYNTRWLPAYIFSYDKRADLERASDPKKVSCSRCEKEMNFLMGALNKLERARKAPSKTGIRLSNAMSPELLAFFDAFANEEAGLLLGNNHWTGQNWRECEKRRVLHIDKTNPSNSVDFRGRYCIASIRSKSWNAKAAERAVEMEARGHFYYPDQKINYERHFRVQLGICLPQACDSRVAETRRADIHKMATFKLSEPLRSYDLLDLYCLPDETSELRKLEPSGRLFVAAAVVWILLVATATLYDYEALQQKARAARSAAQQARVAPQPAQAAPPAAAAADPPHAAARPTLSLGEKLISTFSLIKNWERLFETKSCQAGPVLSERITDLKTAIALAEAESHSDADFVALTSPKLSPSDLLYLNFVKAVLMPLIVYGHAGMLWKFYDRYPNDYDALTNPILKEYMSTVFLVDWYFPTSGFLTAYILFVTRKAERSTLKDWIYSIVHRYWRLAPIYILLFWFVRSVFMYTSAGPLWDYGTNNMTHRAVCRQESWIYPLTLSANLHPIHSSCVMPAWYVSSDFMFYSVSPFLLVLLAKTPILGWLVSLGIIGLSLSARFHRYLTDEHVKPVELMRPRYDSFMHNNWDMYPTYVFPWYRISSYLVGILAGHYAYMVLSGRWTSSIYVNPAALVRANRNEKGRAKSVQQMEYIIEQAEGRRSLVFFVGLGGMLAMLYATKLTSDAFPAAWEPYARYTAAAIYSMHHTIVAVSVSLFLLALILGQFENFMRIMSWPIWTQITRVNYLVFLLQVEALYWFAQAGDHALGLNDLEFVKMILYLWAFLYPVSGVLALVLELPLIQLEKFFIFPLFYNKRPSPPPPPAKGGATSCGEKAPRNEPPQTRSAAAK